jgi:transketolase
LGQGFANGVGMAIAERWMRRHYNWPDHVIIDHHIYAIVSDGDLQEGVASEAASLAGTLKLGKLVYLYDDNDISIEGRTSIAFAENVAQRFQAYGWHVIGPIDGMDIETVDESIKLARAETDRPSLVICRTIIGYGSPNKEGTAAAHGEPLGEEEVLLAKERLGWPYKEPFTVPEEALEHYRLAVERGKAFEEEWETRLDEYEKAYPELSRQLEEYLSGKLPPDWDSELSSLFEEAEGPMATRVASGQAMNSIAKTVHAFYGGSADLAPSTKTTLKDYGYYGFEEYVDHNLHFGVREHAMGSIANGMALHGGIIPYTGTFLIFSDYMRPPMRLAAMMGIRVIYIFTHDSIGLGQDGPTHQPIEQLMSLRDIPRLAVIRPCDANECAEAWRAAMQRENGPTTLVLTRQNLPILDRKVYAPAAGLHKGGYVLWEGGDAPEVILMGTGSEVHIALEAGKSLQEKGVAARVVSLPCWELFDAQPEEYRNEVLPPEIKARVSIEAGVPLGWEHYVGLEGRAMGITRFGASAPYEVLYREFGLTAERMVEEALSLLGRDEKG